jgi:hypothetical protein
MFSTPDNSMTSGYFSMPLPRSILAPLALLAIVACHNDGVSVNPRPPLGGVRFINAVPDGGPVDIRMVDQVEWSASSISGSSSIGLGFRAGTIHWPTEAKARRIRVFPTDSSLLVTVQILHDTTITIEANKNVTLMLVGSRQPGGRVSFVKIDDSPGDPGANKIAMRLVNASSAGQVPSTASGYITASTSSPLPPTATFANVAARSASAYVVRDTGVFAVQATAAGSTTPTWSAAAPAGAPAAGLIGATAGYRGSGSGLSAYVFPRSVAGTAAPQTAAFQSPAIVFFVDLIPAPPR